LFEIYYLTENHVLVRNSDNKTLGELNSKWKIKKQISK